MISYNDLSEILRKERYSEQLQLLPKKFVLDVADYFEEKTKISGKSDDMFSDAIIKTKKQLENAIIIFRDLIKIRRKKILNLVFIASETGISKRDFENMLDFEKELFERIMGSVEYAEKKLNSEMEKKNDKMTEKKNRLIMFIKDVDEFLDIKGNSVGPFKKNDLVNLPKEITKILVDGKKAEFIDENEE